MSAARFTLKGLSAGDALSPRGRYFRVLSDYLAANSTTNAEEAAKSVDALSSLKREGGDPNGIEDFLWGFWGDVDQIAGQISHDDSSQDKLIDVIRELKGLPPNTISAWGNEQRLWTDLPFAGPVFREAWNGPEEGNKTSQDQWVNKNAFLARLFGKSIAPWEPNFAVWTLRDALESDKSQSKELQDCFVAAAATWIDYAGKYLYEWTRNGKGDEQFNNITARGELFQGSSGLSKERWEFWKSRFEALSRQLEVDASRKKAIKAAQRMAEIDSGN